MYSPRATDISEKSSKDLTHAEILDIGNSILDDRELHYQREKSRAIAEAVTAAREKVKRKCEREIRKRLDDLGAQHKIEIASMIDHSEERIQEEIAKREAKLQTEMSEQLRNLQNKISYDMQQILERYQKQYDENLSSEIKNAVINKEQESIQRLEDLKADFETQKVNIRMELEAEFVKRLTDQNREFVKVKEKSLLEQAEIFQAETAVSLTNIREKHNSECDFLQSEIKKRDEYIAKLFKAIEEIKKSRYDLKHAAMAVHEEMKYFIEKTQPFSAGSADFLVPRLELGMFDVEPDLTPP